MTITTGERERYTPLNNIPPNTKRNTTGKAAGGAAKGVAGDATSGAVGDVASGAAPDAAGRGARSATKGVAENATSGVAGDAGGGDAGGDARDVAGDVAGLLRAGERALFEVGDLGASRASFAAAYRAAGLAFGRDVPSRPAPARDEASQSGPARDDASWSSAGHGGGSWGGVDGAELEALGRAALGLGGLWAHERRGAAESALVRVRQRDALRRLDPRSVMALRLRIRLAGEEDYRSGGHAAILNLVGEARGAADPVALAEALHLAHLCALGPGDGPLRQRLAQDLTDQAARTGRRFDLLLGLLWQTVDLFLAGDPHAYRRLAELRAALNGGHLAFGYAVSAMEVMLAVRSGRLDRAEAMAKECARLGAAAGDVNTVGWRAGQLGVIRWYQGRSAELVGGLGELVDSAALSLIDNSAVAGLALAAASAGDTRLATCTLARLCGRDLGDLPRSSSWLMALYCVVEAADLLGDRETASRAYELLAPFAHLPVVASRGAICLGSVQHSLGVAALTLDDADGAVRHLREAVRGNLALGHWPATVLSRWRLGQALVRRDGPDAEAALRELALAESEAAQLGMKLPEADVPAPSVPRRERPSGPARCERHGRLWRVVSGGREAVVEDGVGLRYLAILLANPGADIPAVELAASAALTPAGSGPSGGAAGEPGRRGESVQPVLDEQAKREYKRRLADLQDAVDAAEAAGDAARAATATAERDWLISELAASAGLAGRTRRFADADERARVSVGKAIRRALDRVSAVDAVLGAELGTAIHTGRRCCYRPT